VAQRQTERERERERERLSQETVSTTGVPKIQKFSNSALNLRILVRDTTQTFERFHETTII